MKPISMICYGGTRNVRVPKLKKLTKKNCRCANYEIKKIKRWKYSAGPTASEGRKSTLIVQLEDKRSLL